MRTIIAGSRDGSEMRLLMDAVSACGWLPTVVISGAARGADRLGELWATEHGVALEKHPADWNRHGKSAGYRRNEAMAECAEALIEGWPGFWKNAPNS